MNDLSSFWPTAVTPPLLETRQVEYKAPVSWEDNRRGVIRTALAMSNTEDGGLIVVGVSQTGTQFNPEGIEEEVLSTYNVKTLSHEVCSYGSTGMEMSAMVLTHGEKTFLVLRVVPFSLTPVICVRSLQPNSEGGVREGVVYVRDGTPGSRPAADADFQRLIEMANWRFMKKHADVILKRPEGTGSAAEAGEYEREAEGL